MDDERYNNNNNNNQGDGQSVPLATNGPGK